MRIRVLSIVLATFLAHVTVALTVATPIEYAGMFSSFISPSDCDTMLKCTQISIFAVLNEREVDLAGRSVQCGYSGVPECN